VSKARAEAERAVQAEFGEAWGQFSEKVRKSLIADELHRRYNKAYHQRRQQATSKLMRELKAKGISLEQYLASK
jgi:hypothetical protein